MTRKQAKLIREGRYAAEVDIALIEDDTAWSPYLTPHDVKKLDTVRLACDAATSPRWRSMAACLN